MSAPREVAGGKLVVDHPAESVARLTIRNPAKRNAMDAEILDGITQALADLDARCVIVTGADGMFSAGYDIGSFSGENLAEEAEELLAHPFTAALQALEAYPYPTLAALSGHAIGGGLELALSCDLRIGAEGVKLGLPPARLGLVYSHTGLRKFVDAIGAPRTRELIVLGRTIDSRTAHAWGLVNEVVPAESLPQAAIALATEIAGNAPLSLRGNKRVIRELLDAEFQLDPAVADELMALREACFYSDDFREAVMAFGEKRPPRWRGR